MQIKSNFYDYYDTAQCHSICESNYMFIRYPESYNIDNLRLTYSERSYYGGSLFSTYTLKSTLNMTLDINYDRFYIFFCGKYYEGIRYGSINTYKYFYSMRDFIDFILFKYEKDFRKVNKKNLNKLINSTIKNFNTDSKLLIKKLEKTIDLSNVAIASIEPEHGFFDSELKVTLNPLLRKYKFYKVFSSYQAFQELEMYINSYLVPTDSPQQITDDNIIRDSKGFDKHSFRNSK